jgi:hypothetical protein
LTTITLNRVIEELNKKLAGLLSDCETDKTSEKCERKSHPNNPAIRIWEITNWKERMERIGDKLINKRVPHRKEKWRIQ